MNDNDNANMYEIFERLNRVQSQPLKIDEAAATKARLDESAFQAAIGKKKYGDEGMKALQKAGRDHASDKTMKNIRNKHDKYDEAQNRPMEESKPDFLDLDKDGNKKEPMKSAARDAKKKSVTEGLESIMRGMARDIEQFKRSGELTDELYSALYDHYHDEMPYGVAKARTGDPYEWIMNKLEDELGIDEGNKFSGNLMKARAAGLKKADLDGDGDMEPVREGYKEMQDYMNKKQAPQSRGGEGKKAGIRYGGSAQQDDEEEDTKPAAGEKRGRGRPKKYTDDKPRQERVTAKSRKADRTAYTKKKVGEDYSEDEYDQEGEMAKSQARTIVDAARELQMMLDDNENLPEWVQKKIAMAQDYIDTARDYLESNPAQDGMVNEKAKSIAQQRFMGMAHAMQKGEKIPGASKELKKVAGAMGKSDVKDFAKTKHAGLPQNVKKKTDETTVAGGMAPVAMPMGKKRQSTKEDGGAGGIEAEKPYRDPKSGKTITPPKGATQPPADSAFPPGNKRNMPTDKATKKAEAPASDTAVAETDKNPTDKASTKAKKGGMQFGKGIYDSLNRELEGMISETMDISTSLNSDGPDGPSKSISITATEDDAERLAMLLKMAGLGSDQGQDSGVCPGCGSSDCGCDDMHIDEVTENEPDYPENSGEQQDEVYMLQRLAGGLNGPKRQINPNNMADNPMAMKKLGASNSGAVNIDESNKIQSHLWSLYRKVEQ